MTRDKASSWLKAVGRRLRSTKTSDNWPRRLQKLFFAFLLAAAAGPALIILIYRVLPPPATPLMFIRGFEGYGIDRGWVPLEQISPNLQRAVMASEDAKFCTHNGFDWEAVDKAVDRYQKNQKTKRVTVRGASTISMQTAKNLFLWPGRNFIRKGLEAYLTVWLETLLPKRRILELYLNVVEWGPGIYGAGPASQKYFGVPPSRLTAHQAALLATVLPNPLHWSPARPGPWTADRAGTIEARMRSIALAKETVCP